MPDIDPTAPDNQPTVADPAQEGTAGGGTGDPAAQTTPATGKTVEQLQAELQQSRTNYEELRSFNDRRFNEIQQKLDARETQPVAPVVDEEWESDWEKRINEDPGKNAKAFARGLAAELEAKHQKELAALRTEMQDRLIETDPEFRARKADVERIQKEYGVTREVAAKIVLKELSPSGPSSPPASQAPGRLSPDRSGTQSAPHVETVSFGEGERAFLRYLNLDEKKMAEDLGRDAAKARG